MVQRHVPQGFGQSLHGARAVGTEPEPFEPRVDPFVDDVLEHVAGEHEALGPGAQHVVAAQHDLNRQRSVALPRQAQFLEAIARMVGLAATA